MPAANAHHHSRDPSAKIAAATQGHQDQSSRRARVQKDARPFGCRRSGSTLKPLWRRDRRTGRRHPRG